MRKLARTGVAVVVLLLVGGLGAACDSEQAPETTGDAPEATVEPTQPPETTPPETAPPETTAPEETADETPWWVLLIVLFGLFVLLIALLVGSRRRRAPAAPPAWKAHAQHGYAEARWLSDNLTEPLAIWHGDAEFEGDAGATDASRQRVWDQLSPRLERATAELYALEAAAAPGSPALQASQATIAALNETYSAVTERSDARAAARRVGESEEGVAASELTSARDREARASANLTAAQQRLTASLTELSAIS